MSDKGFTTKGSPEYFAERTAKVQARIDEAKSKIESIESRVRVEIEAIQTERTKLLGHLHGAVVARDALTNKRETAAKLIEEMQSVVRLCDADLPSLDEMLDVLLAEGERVDDALDEAEKSRRRQLHKHERARTRYEGRKTRLELRKELFAKNQPQPVMMSSPENKSAREREYAHLQIKTSSEGNA